MPVTRTAMRASRSAARHAPSLRGPTDAPRSLDRRYHHTPTPTEHTSTPNAHEGMAKGSARSLTGTKPVLLQGEWHCDSTATSTTAPTAGRGALAALSSCPQVVKTITAPEHEHEIRGIVHEIRGR